jgi:hypothetical protein
VRPDNLMPTCINVPENLFLDRKAYSRGWWHGAGDLRSGREFNLPAFHPPKSCPPIKYPRPKPEIKKKLAEVIISQVIIRFLDYTEWSSHFSEAQRVRSRKQVQAVHQLYAMHTSDYCRQRVSGSLEGCLAPALFHKARFCAETLK